MLSFDRIFTVVGGTPHCTAADPCKDPPESAWSYSPAILVVALLAVFFAVVVVRAIRAASRERGDSAQPK
jgi:hypothetical protein